MSLSLDLHWYNLTCVCIVTASTVASLFVIYKHRRKTDKNQTAKSLYESLLSINGGTQSGVETETDNSSFSFVEKNCLWRSSWSFVHPAYLLLFRLTAMAALIGTLLWDWWKYDASIFIYYTDAMSTGDLHSSSDYWIRWQTPLCLLVAVSPAISGAAWMLRRNGGDEERVREEDLWVPCFRGVNPLVLLVYRVVVVLMLLFVFAVFLARRGLLEFYFYTQWTVLLVIIYFLIGALISAHGCWLYYSNQKRKENSENSEENRNLKIEEGQNVNLRSSLISRDNNDNSHERAGILGYSMQITYQTCGGAVMLTDVVFWCLLAPFMQSAHFSVNLVMGCMHSLNLIFLLIDTALNSMPFPMFRMAYFVIWSCIYVIFQWILHLCGFSWWPYPFLELSSPWAPLWYIAMALIHIPCYTIYWLIVKAKNTYFPIFFPNCYVRSN